ncbi:myo-inositol oxygenase [Mycena rebaudengoi]|nr:myo-inositol oxygenase [Mycena rebaudengoi]
MQSDAVDEVNVLKGKAQWQEGSKFDSEKNKAEFRQYEEACDRVKNFYKEQHEKQTVEFNIKMRVEIRKNVRARMGIWEAMEKLNTLVMTPTPMLCGGTENPDWMQVTGLVHDLGKLLYIFGSQCADTFVVGCKYSDKIVLPDTFVGNPDFSDAVYSTEYGVYKPNCGLDNYLYHILKEQSSLPEEGLAMIRYHSFYPWHREGAYTHLTNASDEKALAAVRAFNPYDLYSKSDDGVDVEKLKPYYQGLISRYFPKVIEW